MKAFASSLRGVHGYSGGGGAGATSAYAKAQAARTMVSEHPLVTRHPETGEPQLFVSPGFLRSIVGLNPRENQLVLEMLWEPGSNR